MGDAKTLSSPMKLSSISASLCSFYNKKGNQNWKNFGINWLKLKLALLHMLSIEMALFKLLFSSLRRGILGLIAIWNQQSIFSQTKTLKHSRKMLTWVELKLTVDPILANSGRFWLDWRPVTLVYFLGLWRFLREKINFWDPDIDRVLIGWDFEGVWSLRLFVGTVSSTPELMNKFLIMFDSCLSQTGHHSPSGATNMTCLTCDSTELPQILSSSDFTSSRDNWNTVQHCDVYWYFVVLKCIKVLGFRVVKF